MEEDIVGEPALRKPIDSCPSSIRDEIEETVFSKRPLSIT